MRLRLRSAVPHGLALAVALWLAWAAPQVAAQPAKAPASPVLRDLARIADLRTLFDQERDRIRVVLLLSPT
jgi:hypothetical protein